MKDSAIKISHLSPPEIDLIYFERNRKTEIPPLFPFFAIVLSVSFVFYDLLSKLILIANL